MHGSALIVSMFGLLAASSWGFSNFWGARASKSLGPIASALLINTIGTVLYGVVYVLFLHINVRIDAAAFWYAAASGVVFTVGALAFFRGLKIGPVSIVAPLSGTYPLATIVVALLVFHAHLTLQQFGGIVLVVFGAMTAAELINTWWRSGRASIAAGSAWAFVTAAGWGSSYALLTQSIAHIGWQTASLIELTFVIVGFVIFIPLVKGNEQFSPSVLWRMTFNKFVLAAGLIQLIGMLALNVGLATEGGSGAVVTAISSCCPVITMVLALHHFDEKIKVVPFVGALVTVVGVVVLSF